jgi:hypothetical protein
LKGLRGLNIKDNANHIDGCLLDHLLDVFQLREVVVLFECEGRVLLKLDDSAVVKGDREVVLDRSISLVSDLNLAIREYVDLALLDVIVKVDGLLAEASCLNHGSFTVHQVEIYEMAASSSVAVGSEALLDDAGFDRDLTELVESLDRHVFLLLLTHEVSIGVALRLIWLFLAASQLLNLGG